MKRLLRSLPLKKRPAWGFLQMRRWRFHRVLAVLSELETPRELQKLVKPKHTSLEKKI